MIFKITFKIKLATRVITVDKGIANFTGGFWVNERFEYTVGEDCKYFIPASQITLIEKVN